MASATEVERVEYTPAPLIFLVGHPYPIKGMPTVEAVERVNALKSLLKHGRWPKLTHKTSTTLMCPVAREIAKVSPVWAEILEHDQAYRFRFQDLISETNGGFLNFYPLSETKRLVRLYFERENAFMRRQFWFVRLAPYILAPLVRSFMRKVSIEAMQFDEGDRYWACQKTDYNYMGLSYWMRQKLSKVS